MGSESRRLVYPVDFKEQKAQYSNSGLFQGFCFFKSAENDLKMICRNVKLFLSEPLVLEFLNIAFVPFLNSIFKFNIQNCD